METRKFYVVWAGRAPGIYDSWEECEAVDRKIPPALLAQCECMNEREKFTDIVGTVIDRSETAGT